VFVSSESCGATSGRAVLPEFEVSQTSRLTYTHKNGGGNRGSDTVSARSDSTPSRGLNGESDGRGLARILGRSQAAHHRIPGPGAGSARVTHRACGYMHDTLMSDNGGQSRWIIQFTALAPVKSKCVGSGSGWRPDCDRRSYHNRQRVDWASCSRGLRIARQPLETERCERAARRALARREDHENRRFRASPAVAAFVPNDALEDEPAELCWAGLLII